MLYLFALVSLFCTIAKAQTKSESHHTLHMVLNLDESNQTEELKNFLVKRIYAIWHTIPQLSALPERKTQALSTNEDVFLVTVSWPGPQLITVIIESNGKQLIQRLLKNEDPDATKLLVWYVIKSTINRARLANRSRNNFIPASQIPTAQQSEPDLKTGSVSRQNSNVALLSDNRIKQRAKSFEDRVEALSTDWLPSWTYDCLLATRVADPRLFSVGPALSLDYHWFSQWQIGASVSYQLAPGVVMPSSGKLGLIIHHLPIAVQVGWLTTSRTSVYFGWVLVGDFKIASAHRRHKAVMGLETGPQIKFRFPVASTSLRIVLALAVVIRPIRQVYKFNTGKIAEQWLAIAPAVGVNW